MQWQIYLFSTFFLIQTGVRLSREKFGSLLKYNLIFADDFLTNNKLKTISGILSMFFGILQILNPADVPVIGDIIPALFNLVGGVALLIQGLNKTYDGASKFVLWAQSFVSTNVAIIGVLMVVLGVIHAIFPNIILL